MAPSTSERVKRFEEIGAGIAKALDDLYATSSELYSDRIERADDAIRFKINGEDPRWIDILGPQWTEMLKNTPEENRYFLIQVTFGWQEECRVLQTFQACREDSQVCHRDEVQGSALRIEEEQSSWRLVDSKSPKKWEQSFKFGEGVTDILQWAEQFIADTSRKSPPYEELMLSLAATYFQKLQELMQEVEKVGG
jgi:hypothetical protein